ncbi:MAG: type 3 dihydrofolate reductase [Thiotrichales bacterium]|nr:type 3 dihydrofolate reductase [Thiotrichales bacterium]
MITLIAGMAHNREIGIDNRLPWSLPADLQHFKAETMGKPILMGRKTYDSIGRPLPGRQNIVVSRDADLQLDGCDVVGSIEAALEMAGEAEEVMVMGGASFYEQLLPRAARMVLTMIDLEVEGDAWFPEWSAEEWLEVFREDHLADERNVHPYSFVRFERK